MRALVVGADGFVGRWLTRYLNEEGDDVTALVGPRFQPPLEGATTIRRADVRDYGETSAVVKTADADVVYYLAAVSQAAARERLEDAFRIGLVGAIHVLTASAVRQTASRLIYVSSSHVYEAADQPLTEGSPVRPSSVYGAAKAAAENALLQLGGTIGLDVVVARPFNHIGPGQAASFLVPSLASKVRAIAPGTRGTVTLGSLATVRDFTDVRDVVRAYRVLATTATPFEAYNVASGTGVAVEQIVATMVELAGVDAEVRTDPQLVRTDEPKVMIGDPTKLAGLGWTRSWDLRDTLAEVLDASSTPTKRFGAAK